MKRYPRRSYNFHGFGRDLVDLVRHRQLVKQAHEDLPDEFIRHIMLASTAINRCRYCAWGHMVAGVNTGEDFPILASILDTSLSEVPAWEIPALRFAMYYAETRGEASEQELRALYQTYQQRAPLIFQIVKLINFGNLSGNTIDAFSARLRGQKVEKGSILLEFFTYVFVGTVFRRLMSRSSLYGKMKDVGLVS